MVAGLYYCFNLTEVTVMQGATFKRIITGAAVIIDFVVPSCVTYGKSTRFDTRIRNKNIIRFLSGIL